MVDACPPISPKLYQNWRREAKLRRTSQARASVAKLIAQIAASIHTNARMGISTYLESTESNTTDRSLDHAMGILERRYGKTDSARGFCTRLVLVGRIR